MKRPKSEQTRDSTLGSEMFLPQEFLQGFF